MKPLVAKHSLYNLFKNFKSYRSLFLYSETHTIAAAMNLSDFLSDSKQRYLNAVHEGKGREWTVVMGNEAGDLDSISSSIAYSWFLTTAKNTPSIALIQTRREDLQLRPENSYAFHISSLTPEHSEILCIDDIPPSVSFPSNRFALVDHNVLLSRFSEGNEDVKVVGILDHHVDEGHYIDTADPRMIVVPTGSAASIVAHYLQVSGRSGELQVQILSELSTLLLCAILLDTNGLKPGGKAEALDNESAEYLLKHCTLPAADVHQPSTPSTSGLHETIDIHRIAHELVRRKSSVEHLSTLCLLRRDYKQYEWHASWIPEKQSIHVGLATVPVNLKKIISRKEEFLSSLEDFIDEHNLDVLGILTTYRKEKKKLHKHKEKKRRTEDDGNEIDEEKRVKHKRQVFVVVREVPQGGLQERLWTGLEGSAELELKKATPLYEYVNNSNGEAWDKNARGYKQKNTNATRKVIAPLLKKIIEDDNMEMD